MSGRISTISPARRRRSASSPTEHGGIDILINNAALIINKPFEEFSLAGI